ncbi:MAG: cupin domain-containing protein [Candidatus Sabulitectum sp.]|nr:cupin domain-containing protein [Candidatus Sabulitectum sp.]
MEPVTLLGLWRASRIRKFRVYRVLAPGCSIGLHQHIDEDELYFIIEGSGKVSDGEETHAVMSGHSILTRSGESHSIENTGSMDLILIAVIPQAHTQ